MEHDRTLPGGLRVGQKFASGQLKVARERIKSFAAEFDPQPFHLDEEVAKSSLFKSRAASGWHTAAMTMRLLVESELKPVGGIIGLTRSAMAASFASPA